MQCDGAYAVCSRFGKNKMRMSYRLSAIGCSLCRRQIPVAERQQLRADSPLARAHHFLHLARQLLQAERLRQEVDLGVAVESLAEGILDVAGDEDDLHVGMRQAH